MMSVCRSVCMLVAVCVLLLVSVADAKLKEGECDVCIGSLTKLKSEVTSEQKKTVDSYETYIKEWCEAHPHGNKEERFCYLIGGLEASATKTIKDVSVPLHNNLPPARICEKLKKTNSAICELAYDKEIDLSNPAKLKIKELKKVLANWGEKCNGCAEKADFVKMVNDLKHKHTEL
ncbi:hypothetical protein SARC_02455 [Sphaeroforma arctica JP610]|uniref:Mesencephalic astrocyte-derived neurotrophic factor homolog n=1 Tax=Sphaeroforma arctica JP610 TaxID=667725 RepID=A0A0L0GAR8_9EUKA|nr:hypothetical protein SARC_02455 [Sphaeroforma arctica JP610]KNC85363.1 hypothetical protein SARC_02455 [Sphaeroforma arctica JP610]|eukprot:XP_014159265.1 hypothetical protein SARC_02455 [Sphaeroforma arctica JP610]